MFHVLHGLQVFFEESAVHRLEEAFLAWQDRHGNFSFEPKSISIGSDY